MKSIFSSAVLALLAIFTFEGNGAVSLPIPSPLQESGSTQAYRAVMYEGQWIPLVNLPLVEIISTPLQGRLSLGVLQKGHVVIKANLPEVVISAPKNRSQRYPVRVADGNEYIVAGLPVIEITSSHSGVKLCPAKFDVHEGVVAVNGTLPQVEIEAEKISGAQYAYFWKPVGNSQLADFEYTFMPWSDTPQEQTYLIQLKRNCPLESTEQIRYSFFNRL